MYPIFYKYGWFAIGGYGVMLGLGFYFAFLLFERELKLRHKDPELAYKILLAAIPCGIIGAKVFHILEHLQQFRADPWGMLFSGAGLSVYGGLLLALLVSYIISKRNKENFLEITDIVAPSLALGYCFGRFGCHVAGDGCYGIESSSLLAIPYPNGIVPSSQAVYPTPLFEVFFSFLVVGFLLKLRKKELPTGTIFFLYLILNGVPRFLVEFIRLNPKIFLGMTQAQWVALGLIAAGIAGLLINLKKKAGSVA
jgi:phosphatidylglycerol---prolipoprotein diacylglyceryl transferase